MLTFTFTGEVEISTEKLAKIIDKEPSEIQSISSRYDDVWIDLSNGEQLLLPFSEIFGCDVDQVPVDLKEPEITFTKDVKVEECAIVNVQGFLEGSNNTLARAQEIVGKYSVPGSFTKTRYTHTEQDVPSQIYFSLMMLEERVPNIMEEFRGWGWEGELDVFPLDILLDCEEEEESYFFDATSIRRR